MGRTVGVVSSRRRECPRDAHSGEEVGVSSHDHMSPGCGRGRHSERKVSGGQSVVQEVAFITLMINTILPGTANSGHSRAVSER